MLSFSVDGRKQGRGALGLSPQNRQQPDWLEHYRDLPGNDFGLLVALGPVLRSSLWHGEGVIDFDPEIANGAFDLGMSQEQLDRPQVTGAAVNEGRFGSAQRVLQMFGNEPPMAPSGQGLKIPSIDGVAALADLASGASASAFRIAKPWIMPLSRVEVTSAPLCISLRP
jgi:hypothetical protein